MPIVQKDTSFQLGTMGAVVELEFLDLRPDGSMPVLDISAATTKNILIKKPDGTVNTETATFTNTGTDGLLRFTTPDTAYLNQTGEWEVQGFVDTPTWSAYSSTESFTVEGNLDT